MRRIQTTVPDEWIALRSRILSTAEKIWPTAYSERLVRIVDDMLTTQSDLLLHPEGHDEFAIMLAERFERELGLDIGRVSQ